jgi:hypothetical protein
MNKNETKKEKAARDATLDERIKKSKEFFKDKKQVAADSVAIAKRHWENTGNPLSVWRAYSESRNAGLAVPEWVYKYFDRVSINLWHLSVADGINPPKNKRQVDRAIAAALEMKAKGKCGGKNVFSTFHENDMVLATEVYLYVIDGHKPGLSCKYVSNDHKGKPSTSTVKRAWKKYRPIFYPEDSKK